MRALAEKGEGAATGGADPRSAGVPGAVAEPVPVDAAVAPVGTVGGAECDVRPPRWLPGLGGEAVSGVYRQVLAAVAGAGGPLTARELTRVLERDAGRMNEVEKVRTAPMRAFRSASPKPTVWPARTASSGPSRPPAGAPARPATPRDPAAQLRRPAHPGLATALRDPRRHRGHPLPESPHLRPTPNPPPGPAENTRPTRPDRYGLCAATAQIYKIADRVMPLPWSNRGPRIGGDPRHSYALSGQHVLHPACGQEVLLRARRSGIREGILTADRRGSGAPCRRAVPPSVGHCNPHLRWP